MDKRYIFLKSPIGSGGEANIYTVQINSELVAKVYHQPHGDYARKLAFMVANPPVDPLAKEGRVSIAWATELVTDLGLVVGFLMPKLDTSKAKPIFQYYNPSERRKESPTFSYVSLLRTARNLARAVRSVHSRGYVIGDVNESNVLVAEDAIVTLVDTDSFQVNDGTTVYRCTVGKPEYTPPELQGVSFRDVDRSVEHDLFGLGVLIYQLLMEGTHPFGGVFRGQGEAPELKERIKAGHFPHGRRGVPYNPMPLAPSFQMLPVALQELFLLCFEVGHGNPAARPTADVWSKALGEAEDGLIKCGVNGQHFYSGHLGVCPWCERAVKLGGRDPFPVLGAISSGQHTIPLSRSQISNLSNPSATTSPSSKNNRSSTPQTILWISLAILVIVCVLYFENLSAKTRTQQAIAKSYVRSMTRMQQAFYLEQRRFASFDEISDSFGSELIKSETDSYSYKIFSVNGLNSSSNVTYQVGQAKQKDLKSYVSAVKVTQQDSDTIPISIVCETDTSTTSQPPLPVIVGDGKLECAVGTDISDRIF